MNKKEIIKEIKKVARRQDEKISEIEKAKYKDEMYYRALCHAYEEVSIELDVLCDVIEDNCYDCEWE